jgi:hypothetical protein
MWLRLWLLDFLYLKLLLLLIDFPKFIGGLLNEQVGAVHVHVVVVGRRGAGFHHGVEYSKNCVAIGFYVLVVYS